jgi:Ca2+-binding RTX toxin-like protein
MHIESLSARRLFAATAVLDGDTLVITGTDDAESIRIRDYDGTRTSPLNPDDPPRIVVADGNVLLGIFDLADVNHLVASLGAGDDVMMIQDFTDARLLRFDATIAGGSGDDHLYGTAQADVIIGGSGRDLLAGAGGNDMLRGGADADVIHGGEGDDTLIGHEGNDRLVADAGADQFFGGKGSDAVDYSEYNAPVEIRLGLAPDAVGANGRLLLDGRERVGERTSRIFDGDGNVISGGKLVAAFDPPDTSNYFGTGGAENDVIHHDIENAFGSRKSDLIIGNTDDNILHGLGGNDMIVGGLGHDTLYGGAGRDFLMGADNRDGMPVIYDPENPSVSRGYDRLVGGPGVDRARTDSGDVLVSIASEDQLHFTSS